MNGWGRSAGALGSFAGHTESLRDLQGGKMNGWGPSAGGLGMGVTRACLETATDLARLLRRGVGGRIDAVDALHSALGRPVQALGLALEDCITCRWHLLQYRVQPAHATSEPPPSTGHVKGMF